jgi:hypothetical protein
MDANQSHRCTHLVIRFEGVALLLTAVAPDRGHVDHAGAELDERAPAMGAGVRGRSAWAGEQFVPPTTLPFNWNVEVGKVVQAEIDELLQLVFREVLLDRLAHASQHQSRAPNG